jgi:hypothetical protein
MDQKKLDALYSEVRPYSNATVREWKVSDLAMQVCFNEVDPHGHTVCGYTPLKKTHYPLVGMPRMYHPLTVGPMGDTAITAENVTQASWGFKHWRAVEFFGRMFSDRNIHSADIVDSAIVDSATGERVHSLGSGFQKK